MNVVLSPQALKYLECMNEQIKGRIKAALRKLGQELSQGDATALSAQSGYRLRVGGYRVLFGIKDEITTITDIAPRGQAYKGR